jgi:hypothetical protein
LLLIARQQIDEFTRPRPARHQYQPGEALVIHQQQAAELELRHMMRVGFKPLV